MRASAYGAFSSIWLFFPLCSAVLWLYSAHEKRSRRKVKKELPKGTQVWQNILLGMSMLTSLCQLPIPLFVPISVWCWGVVVVTGLLSTWVGIRHIWLA